MRFMHSNKAVLALALMMPVALAFMMLTHPVNAQSNISGDIAGTVTDASGAALPNAQVTVTSLEKGQAKVVLSDRVGDYRVPLLSPGRYQVKATAKGFETSTVQVTVSAGSVTPVNIALTVGQASTTIEVNGG